jgi:hypothetical protein
MRKQMKRETWNVKWNHTFTIRFTFHVSVHTNTYPNISMLAQLPTSSPLHIASWLGCLFFLVAGWNQVERFFDRRAHRPSKREIQPQPLSVAKFDPPVPETLCRSRRKELSGELNRLEHELTCLRQERRSEVGQWQQKICEVNREVGELRASIELNNQHLMRIDSKLDRVIERQNS